jgi:hypothetical protein
VDRDALLAAALGAAVVTGCTAPRRVPALPSPSTSPPPDPDAALLSSWALAERRTAGLYAATGPLATLRANHLARAAAAEALLAARGASPSPPPAVPARPAAVAALVAAERALAAGYVAALGRVTDSAVAVLGAELAAGARQHAALLPLVPARR